MRLKKRYKMKTPLDYYHELIKSGKLEINPQQESVLDYLTEVCQRLIQRQKLHRRIFSKSVPGLYLWGSVGVGKTMIMDCFYQALPTTKLRLHFHAFMRQLHQELHQWQGQENPLTAIGKRMARQYAVICFDEFLVTNVADAMLMAELFKTLFARGVCIVTTANLPPEKLYEQGLQRQRFLPVIDLITQYTRVWHLSLQHDYRRRALEQIAAYYTPLSEEAEEALFHALQRFSGDDYLSSQPLLIAGREIPVKQRSQKAVWFEFNVICGRPRSQNDYLELTQQYSVVLISHVPCLETVSKDFVVAFINLVDILYDTKVRLIVSAAVPIAQLYTHGEFQQVFQRTESRLTEMQTKEYQIHVTDLRNNNSQ